MKVASGSASFGGRVAVVRVGRVGQVVAAVRDRDGAVRRGAGVDRRDLLLRGVGVGVVGADVDRRRGRVLGDRLGVVDRDRRVVGEQDRDVVRVGVGGGEVGFAVAVEVADRDRGGTVAGGFGAGGGGGEVAGAVAEQDRHVVRADVGGGEVGFAVAVEVADRDRDGTVAGGFGAGGGGR